MPDTELSSSQPYRTLREIDAEIDQAERTGARCLLDLEDQTAAARSTVRAEAALRLADERLARLREERRARTSGEVRRDRTRH